MPPAADLSQYRGVWVFLEARHGQLRQVSLQLIGKGRKLADQKGVLLSGVLLGHGVEPLAQEAIGYGADQVYLVEHPLLATYSSRPFTKVLAKLVFELKPEVLLFGGTKNGRDLGGRLHSIIDTGLAADCTQLNMEEDGNLDMVRPAFGGQSLAHILCRKHRPQMASVRQNVFEVPPKQSGGKGQIIRVPAELTERDQDCRLLEFKQFTRTEGIDITEAKTVIAGGFGLGGPEHFKLLKETAELLGAAVGASRKPVDSGWVPKAFQVGQTGRTVRPRLYIAVAISGAVQHLAGMQESGRIVSINTDPHAPILKISDYGIIGDLFEVLPELIAQLRSPLPVPAAAQGLTGGARMAEPAAAKSAG